MTLRDYRLQMGLSLDFVASQVSSLVEREKPYTAAAVQRWELRGVSRADVISALAYVYDVPMPSMTRAARQKGPLLKRGRKPNNLLQNVS